MNKKVLELLHRTKIEVAPETFTLVSLRHENWLKLLELQSLLPQNGIKESPIKF